jgi:hypothetical protein
MTRVIAEKVYRSTPAQKQYEFALCQVVFFATEAAETSNLAYILHTQLCPNITPYGQSH